MLWSTIDAGVTIALDFVLTARLGALIGGPRVDAIRESDPQYLRAADAGLPGLSNQPGICLKNSTAPSLRCSETVTIWLKPTHRKPGLPVPRVKSWQRRLSTMTLRLRVSVLRYFGPIRKSPLCPVNRSSNFSHTYERGKTYCYHPS